MSENVIFVKKYDEADKALVVNEREVLRYAGYLGLPETMDETLRAVFAQVVEELKGAFSYQVCYRRMEVTWEDGMPLFPLQTQSKDLARCLNGSSEVILFAATVGLEIDRHIAKHQRFSPTKALLMQAYGAERVETLCNAFCGEIKRQAEAEGLQCTARFSPGYGDLPLEAQRDVFRLLDCNRKIGISLNESLLMTPSKSVTALFGMGAGVCPKQEHKCERCEKMDCDFRSDDVRA